MSDRNKAKLAEAASRSYELMQEIDRDERNNPLTLEDAIRSVILKNPYFCPYRDLALGTIYTLLGSGIEWIDGRRGDRRPNNYMNLPPQAGGQGCWSTLHGREESLSAMWGDGPRSKLQAELEAEWDRQEKDRVQQICDTVTDIDTRCEEYSPKPPKWYPISWYGCGLCVPCNAKKDFRLGAIETVGLIISQEPPTGTQEWRDHQRTKGYAFSILQALDVS